MRLRTGVAGFDEMVQGGLPEGTSVVLQGPPGQEKVRFALTFLAEGLKAGASGIVLVSSQSPDSILAELRDLEVDLDAVTRENRLRIVDWYTQREEPVQDVEEKGVVFRSSIDLTNVGVALSRAIAALGGSQPKRAVVELLSPAMSVYEVGQVYAFAQSSKGKFVRFNFTALFLIEKDMHPAADLSTLHQPFDGVIEIERTRVGDTIVRKIGVLHMKDTTPDSAFRTLEMTEKGIRVVRGTPPATAPSQETRPEPPPRPAPLGAQLKSVQAAEKPAATESKEESPTRAYLIMQIARERLKLNPGDADALFAMAAAQATLDDARGALEALDRLSKIDERYPGLWVLKTKLHARMGEADRARASRARAEQNEDVEGLPPEVMVNCPLCDAVVSERASQCPKCGARFLTETDMAGELDALGQAAIQEKVEAELGAEDLLVSGAKKAAPKLERITAKPPAKAVASPKKVEKPSAKQGLTNGLVRERAAKARPVGMTNGLRGRTNGLTNGLRGRTNGLTNGLRGRTNGLTNGLGRTNGLTNGMGRTNGLTNGLGRTNGVTNGLTNGLVSLRRGITNGLTNGNGFTNGLGSPRFQREVRLNRWKLYVIPVVMVGLLILPLFLSSDLARPPSAITIDGRFDDWSSIRTYVFRTGVANPNVDLTRIALLNETYSLSLLVEVQGQALAGSPVPPTFMDAVYVFVDLDGSPATGYPIEGIGADRLLEIQGSSGTVRRALAYRASSSVPDRRDWRTWTDPAPIAAASNGNRLEVAVEWLLLGEARGLPVLTVATLGWDGARDTSDIHLGPLTGHVRVVQRSVAPPILVGPDIPLLTIDVEAIGADATISDLTLDLLGTAAVAEVSRLRLSDVGGVLAETTPGASRVTLPLSGVIVPDGTTVTWAVSASSSSSSGRTFGAILLDASAVAASGAVVTLRTASSPERLSYLGQVPVAPIVDGAFAEWTRDVLDATGEGATLGNPSADLERFGAATGAANLTFHVRLRGPAFAGTVVTSRPAEVPPGPIAGPDQDRDTVPDSEDLLPADFNNDGVPDAQASGDHDGDGSIEYAFGGPDLWLNTTIPASFPAPYAGRNVTVYVGPTALPPQIGEDEVRLYVDADNVTATGFLRSGIGADYLVEIRGREGLIASASLSSFDGASATEWRWLPIASVPFALSDVQFEARADLLPLVPFPSMYLEISDWIGGSDSVGPSVGFGAPALSASVFVGPTPSYVPTDGGGYAYRSSGTVLESYVTSTRGPTEELLLRYGTLFIGWRTADLAGVLDAPESPAATPVRVVGSEVVLTGFSNAWEVYELGADRIKHNVWLESPPVPGSTVVALQGELRIPDGGVVLVGGVPVSGSFRSSSPIVVEYDGYRIRLEAPYAYESRRPETRVDGWYEGDVQGSTVRLSMAVPSEWLRDATREFPVVLDPTGIIDTATATPTGGPAQRNIFHDGSNFWAFYSDGTNTVYEPSTDGLSWVGTKTNAFATSSVVKPSVWFHDTGSTKIVYVVGDSGGNDASVVVRRGTISGTTITWGSDATATVGSANLASKTAFITRDSNGFLWIGSSSKSAGGNNFDFSAARSTNADDVSAWDAHTFLLDASIASGSIQGQIVPLGSGEVYAVWYADGLIDGKKYSGSWGTKEAIDTTTAGVLTKAPSAVVDGSFNIHLAYVDSSGAVKYRQRTGSWGAATTLDAGSGNTYATITRETSTGDLYAFYIASSNQITAQKYSGSWSSLTLETNTVAKSALTSIYQIGRPAQVSWTWSQGSASPFDVKFSLVGMDAMYVRQGTFVRKLDGTGSQSITGVGFQPKALILWYARVADQAHTANDYGGFGFAASSSQRYAIALGSDNGVGTTNTGKGSAAAVLRIFSAGAPTLDGAADLSSFDANGFTLSWTTNPNPAQATIIHYVAIGGPGVTNAYAGQFTGPSAGGTGSRAFSGVGFRGDFGLFLSTNQAATGDTTGESFSLGAAVSSSKRWVLAGGGNDGVTAVTHAETFVSASNVLASYATGASAAALTTDNVADFVSWDSNGFTLSYSKATTGSILFWGLILKGGLYDAGNFQVPNSGATPFDQSITGVGFRPKGVMLLGDNRDTLDSEGGNFERMIGAGSEVDSAVYESLVWSFNRNIVTTDSGMRAKTTKAIGLYSSSGTTINEADYKRGDSDGFTVTHATISAATKRILYFAFGDSGPSSRTVDTSTDSASTKYNHQRKVFHDGSRFWAFYYDGSNTVYTSSADGLTWGNSVDRAFTTAAVGQASVWFHDTGSTKIVYAVGDGTLSDTTLAVRRGTISGGTITWGTQASATISSSNHVPKIAYVARDTNGNLWIVSSAKDTMTTFNIAAVRSTNVDDVSSWGSITYLLSAAISVDSLFPMILPMAGGDMYALWYADGAIDGREYTGTWGSVENIATTTASVTTKLPSAVVDGSDNVHLVYVDSAGSVQYKKRTGSWGAASSLDFLRPEWDVDTGTWTPTPQWSRLDDNDDTDYVSATGTGTDEVGLTHISDPGVDTAHVIRFRARATGAGPDEQMQVGLYQGGTLIAQTAVTTITRGSFNPYSYALTSGEASAITDYSDLRLRLTVSTIGGGGDQLDLAWAELEVPGRSGSKSPTVTRDTATGDLYAFYIATDGQIRARKLTTIWSLQTEVDLSITSKDYLTSPYAISSSSFVSWLWGQGGSSPYEIKVQVKIPEFGEVVLPVAGVLFVVSLFQLRRRFVRRDEESVSRRIDVGP